MTPSQIQVLIEYLRTQQAANSITPDMVANILTYLNTGATLPAGTTPFFIEQRPLLYCEVKDKKLFLKNFAYYESRGLVPILFRYIRKRNSYSVGDSREHGPYKKGWFANGKQGTLSVDEYGQVYRSNMVVSGADTNPEPYSELASKFINDGTGDDPNRVTWGCCKISNTMDDDSYRMLRLPFAIAYAPSCTIQSRAVTLADIESNLAPFFIRGQKCDDSYVWAFSK